LQLVGTRKILEFMDWGDCGAKGTFINIGSIGISIIFLPTLIYLESNFNAWDSNLKMLLEIILLM